MTVIGDVGGGRMGPMTKDQIVTWLEAKDSRNVTKPIRDNLKSCVETLMAASGSTASGGGNKRYTFEGDATYHESSGAGAGAGSMIMYVKRAGNVAKVVGLGYHVGAQTYDLTWVHHDWGALRGVNRVTLDKKG